MYQIMLDRKRIIIVGGGVAGLTAGIYAEQNGFHAIILEKHMIPGGLCTGWYRKGFYIDGCTHWLNGTKPGTELYRNWTNLGAFSKDDTIIIPSWGSFEYQGQVVTFWNDLEKAEKEWVEISPADKKRIHSFFKKVKKFQKVELPLQTPIHLLPFKIMWKFLLSFIPHTWTFLNSMFRSKEKYIDRFTSPALRWALTRVQPGGSNLYTLLYSYSQISIGNGGVIKGGSLPMIERMRDKFESLGGVIKCNCPVDHIIIENKTAVGVELDNGEKLFGDYVISALDVHYALQKLLQNKYDIPSYSKRYKNPERCPSPGCVLIHFAIKDMPNINVPYSFECEPFILGKERIDHLTLRNFSFDSTFVNKDKVVVQVLLDQTSAHYDYWGKLYKSPEEYHRKKRQVAELVKSKIIAKFPSLKENIEILDVATPKTFNRYTNTTRGVFMPYLFTNKDFIINHNGKIPGLKNFYLAGQWLRTPGGLPLAMSSGRFVIQRINLIERYKSKIFGVKKALSKM